MPNDTGQSVDEKAPYTKEDAEILNFQDALADGNTTKVERSPCYADILRTYLRMKDDPKFNVSRFQRHVVVKLDPELSVANVRAWIDKINNNKKKVWDNKVRVIASEARDADASIQTIRDTAIKVFYMKIMEFIDNPEMMDKMTFKEALQLYDRIEKLHLATERLNIDKNEQGRKNVFTVFSMGLLSGQKTEQDVRNLLGDNNEQPVVTIEEGTGQPNPGTPEKRV